MDLSSLTSLFGKPKFTHKPVPEPASKPLPKPEVKIGKGLYAQLEEKHVYRYLPLEEIHKASVYSFAGRAARPTQGGIAQIGLPTLDRDLHPDVSTWLPAPFRRQAEQHRITVMHNPAFDDPFEEAEGSSRYRLTEEIKLKMIKEFGRLRDDSPKEVGGVPAHSLGSGLHTHPAVAERLRAMGSLREAEHHARLLKLDDEVRVKRNAVLSSYGASYHERHEPEAIKLDSLEYVSYRDANGEIRRKPRGQRVPASWEMISDGEAHRALHEVPRFKGYEVNLKSSAFPGLKDPRKTVLIEKPNGLRK